MDRYRALRTVETSDPPIVTRPMGSTIMSQPNYPAHSLSTQAMQSPPHTAARQTSSAARQAVLWIDGIGGYLLWDKPELVIGQAFADGQADVGITGDLSRRAAIIRRLGSDYLIQPLQPTQLNGQAIDRAQLLRDGAIIELGSSVKLRFCRPHVLTGTAKLELVSIHRWKPNVDAVVLLADCCMIGPRPGSHIACPDWRSEVLLLPKATKTTDNTYDAWQMRVAEDVQVNSQNVGAGQFSIASGMRVRGEDFSLSFE